MDSQCNAAAGDWLRRHSRVSGTRAAALAALAPDLTKLLADGDSRTVAVSGAPGTGKSTLARMLAAVLERQGHSAPVLSLDDYYLPRADRDALAMEIHPLLATRGVPGTHDIETLTRDLDALRSTGARYLEVPRFDKARDERADRPRVLQLRTGRRVVFIEGWVAGAPPQAGDELEGAVNDLERRHDHDASWRKWVNAQLARYHRTLNGRLTDRWHLRAPGWDRVIDWRWRQERELRGDHRHLEDRMAVAGFLAHYERLCRHMDATCGQWADAVIVLDHEHHPTLEIAA